MLTRFSYFSSSKSLKMLGSGLSIFFFCLLAVTSSVSSNEIDAKPSYVSFPASENGTCYMRVPYDEDLEKKIADGVVKTATGFQAPSGNAKTGDRRELVTIIDCCDGFTRDAESGKCETHCEEGCFGGTCTGPNVCTCEDGWYAEAGVCKPICRKPCAENAYCFSSDFCTCKFGYEEIEGVCRPVCLNGCLNGDCVAPRDCRCHPGFFLNESKACEPVPKEQDSSDLPGSRFHASSTDRPASETDADRRQAQDSYRPQQPNQPAGYPGFRRPDDMENRPASTYYESSTPGGTDYGTDRSTSPRPYKTGDPIGPGSPQQGPFHDRPRAPASSQGPRLQGPFPAQGPYGGEPGPRQDGVNPYATARPSVEGRLGEGRNPLPARADGAHRTPGVKSPPRSPSNEQQLYITPENWPYVPSPASGAYTPYPYGQPGADPNHFLTIGMLLPYDALGGRTYEVTCGQGYSRVEPDNPYSNVCVPICPGGCENGICAAPNNCLCRIGFVKERPDPSSQRCVPAHQYTP